MDKETSSQPSLKPHMFSALVVLAAVAVTINWLLMTPGDCTVKGMAIGASVCHQIPSHSFHLDEMQFPICARCSGLYLGSLVGIGYYLTQGRRAAPPRRSFIALLLLLTIAWGGDGVNSLVSDFLKRPFLYSTNNLTRLVTGFGMGLTLSTALVTLFNMTVWQNPEKKALLHNPWQLAAYTGLSGISGYVLLNGNTLIFKGLAAFSVLTVVLVISALYTIFWVIALRKENNFTRLKDLAFFFMAGFASAMAQITLLVWLRTALLG